MKSSNVIINWQRYKETIAGICNLPEEEWKTLISLITVTTKQKGTQLLKTGDRCEQIVFLVKGAARLYYLNDKGDDVTYSLLFENNFLVSFDGFFNDVPSAESIILLEPSTLLILKKADFDVLLKRHPAWEVLLNALLKKYFFVLNEKEKMLLLESHESRYKKLFSEKPHIFQRVEQQYIASYLGMTPETLSRIKKKIHSKT